MPKKLTQSLESPKNGKFFTIAIDGRGASGKTSLIEYLKPYLPGFTLLNFDDYFEPRDGTAEWGYLNKDRFNQDVIKALQDSNEFIYKPYDWHAEPHISEKKVIINKGMVLEGLFSLDFNLDWDLRIWVDTPKEICLQRGIERDALGMGQSRAETTWRDVWQPNEDKYITRIQPEKIADFILDGTKPFGSQLI